MQHAIMIMAHKNMEQLCHLVEYFTHDCYVLIHLDKKFKVSKEERERLEAFPQVVKVYQKFDVNWGGFSMLRCQPQNYVYSFSNEGGSKVIPSVLSVNIVLAKKQMIIIPAPLQIEENEIETRYWHPTTHCDKTGTRLTITNVNLDLFHFLADNIKVEWQALYN